MKRVFRVLGLVLIMCMVFTAISFASTGQQNEKITYRSISIVVNGTEIAPCDVNGNSTEPFIRNADGSTYLPVRAVAGALGLDVDWDNDTNTVILKNGGKVQTGTNKPVKTNKTVTASLYYRNIVITLDGNSVALKNAQGNPVEPFIKDGTTYIPVRAVATALGCEVGWNGDTNTVTITKGGAVDPATQPLKVDVVKSPAFGVIDGTPETFQIKATGGKAPYQYEWQYLLNDKWQTTYPNSITYMASGDTLKVHYNAYMDTVKLRCNVTDASGQKVTSETMTSNAYKMLKASAEKTKVEVIKGESESVLVKVEGGQGVYYFYWQYYDSVTGTWKDIKNIPSIKMSGNQLTQTLTEGGKLYTVRCVVKDSVGLTVESQPIVFVEKTIEGAGEAFIMYIDQVATFNKSNTNAGIVISGTIVNGTVKKGDYINIYDSASSVSNVQEVGMIVKNGSSVTNAGKGQRVSMHIGAPYGFDSSGNPVLKDISMGDSVIMAGPNLFKTNPITRVAGKVHLFNTAEWAEANPGVNWANYSNKTLSKGDNTTIAYARTPNGMISTNAQILSTGSGNGISMTMTRDDVEVKLTSYPVLYENQKLLITNGTVILGTFTVSSLMQF